MRDGSGKMIESDGIFSIPNPEHPYELMIEYHTNVLDNTKSIMGADSN